MISVLAFLAGLSLLLALWQWVMALRFPLHQRVTDESFTPAVTLLKPLKGWDAHSEECLRSWFKQDYPAAVQMLLGIASPGDPAVAPVQRLLAEHPELKAQLVFCQDSLGANAKVSTLIQLSRLVQNEIVIVSDADVLVPSDYILNAVGPLAVREVGLVNSFYRLANPTTMAMRCEAIAVNADFWSQVLQGQSLQPLDFALGAVMATRRADLVAIGGFESLADYLADDYQLGNRIVGSGKRVALCPVVVDCISPPMGWLEVWDHQLRWSRTIRVCKPLPYAFSILSNATLWPLLWLWLTNKPASAVLPGVGICLLTRIAMAQSLQSRLGSIKGAGRYWWLAPVKDLMQSALWLMSFFGNQIEWRGQLYQLQRDGKLTPVTAMDSELKLL